VGILEPEGKGKHRPGSPDEDQCATAREVARIAAKLFAERGYDATPVRAIAEAAGVTCPTMYYHFGSKEGLAQALITRPLGGIVERYRALLDREMDPVERLELLVDAHFEFCRQAPDRMRLVYAVMFGPLGGDLAGEVNAYIVRLGGLMNEAVGKLAEAGLIAPERVAEMALTLRGQFIIRCVEFMYRGGELPADLARRVVAATLHGYAEPAGRRADQLTERPSRETGE
jgi:AcrR family transcriptional regulator